MRRLILSAIACVAIATAGPHPAADYIPRLERNLKENIVPFWLNKSLDETNGGYIINHDAAGKANPAGTKGIVTQARQVWLFSRLAREGYQKEKTLAAARHGFVFLRDHLWDSEHGGFFWEVDATGSKSIKPKKHMYGQSFGLYALSEYYRASKDPQALALAEKLFALFENRSYDKQYGGYVEFFNRDWSTPASDETTYMGGNPSIKLMNTHLHLMEALTAYYLARPDPLTRDRLRELIDIETNTVVRFGLGACTDKYGRDWTPLLDRDEYARVSYGHDLENVWLIIDALNAIGDPVHPFLDLFRTLWAYSLKHGYDEANGGFFYWGAFGKPAQDRHKSWWVQAEALVSALYMYRYAGEEKYLNVFRRTADFVDRYQTDWKTGEWHPTVSPDNATSGGKANIWKGGYHNGRAMLEALQLLRSDSVRQ